MCPHGFLSCSTNWSEIQFKLSSCKQSAVVLCVWVPNVPSKLFENFLFNLKENPREMWWAESNPHSPGRSEGVTKHSCKELPGKHPVLGWKWHVNLFLAVKWPSVFCSSLSTALTAASKSGGIRTPPLTRLHQEEVVSIPQLQRSEASLKEILPQYNQLTLAGNWDMWDT